MRNLLINCAVIALYIGAGTSLIMTDEYRLIIGFLLFVIGWLGIFTHLVIGLCAEVVIDERI